jgi:hypothetical protein
MTEDTYFHADLDEVESLPSLYAQSVQCTVDSVEMQVGMLSGPPRKGKWTLEEENYANKIIKYFNTGMLSLEAGTTLRSYLSDRLHWYQNFPNFKFYLSDLFEILFLQRSDEDH